MTTDKKTILTIVTALLETLAEPGCDGMPESTGYMVCNMQMELWTIVRDLMVGQNWIVVSPGPRYPFVTITQSGRDLVAQSV